MYLVKVVLRAKENNPNFAGDVHVYLYGKKQKLIAKTVSHRFHIEQDIIPYFVKEYGYKRECDARRSYMFTHAEDEKYWAKEVSIYEINC